MSIEFKARKEHLAIFQRGNPAGQLNYPSQAHGIYRRVSTALVDLYKQKE